MSEPQIVAPGWVPSTYMIMRVRMTLGSPLTFVGGERIIAVTEMQHVPGLARERDVTLLVELPLVGEGDDMTGQLGDPQDVCPSCGGKDDHNWIRSAGGLISCQKRTEAHREGM